MTLDSARADRVTAVLLFLIGAAMLAGGWSMERLEIRRIHPASIPGLVPMILGGLLAICAILLFAGARGREHAEAPVAGAVDPDAVSWRSAGLSLLLCLVYAVGLVGTLTFFWATAIFVAAFAFLFAPAREAGQGWRDPRALALSAGFGLAVAAAISVLFRYAFLVRLP